LGDGQGPPEIEQIGAAEAFSHSLGRFATFSLVRRSYPAATPTQSEDEPIHFTFSIPSGSLIDLMLYCH